MATLAKQTGFGRRRAGGLMILSMIALCAVGVFALGYVGYVLWPRWPEAAVSPDAPALPIVVGDTLFNVPPAAIRVAVQRRAGRQDRLDLAFQWPTLLPPEPTSKAGASAPTTERVFLTIANAGAALPPVERLKSLYPRYAESLPSPAPDGLALFAFRDNTPYQGEDLVFDPTAPARFMARCSRPLKGTPGTCLGERRIGDADVTARFPRDWLANWRETSSRLDRLIDQIGPRPAS